MILSIVDYSLERRIKPYQNGVLILTFLLLFVALLCASSSNTTIRYIFTWLILGSGVCLLLFLLLSLICLYHPQIGQLKFSEHQVDISKDGLSEIIAIEHIVLMLNIDDAVWNDSATSIDKKIGELNRWGNYLITGSGSHLQ